jgi:type IV pilus assembly protein PilQ
MTEIKAVINMKVYRFSKILPFIFALVCIIYSSGWAQSQNQIQDKLPVREYTNPNEVVTFDRTTPFTRALDVINKFAQSYRNKIIIDRTKTEGNIGISVPPMHWMDALKLILNVKGLRLVEQKDYYEIVTPESLQPQAQLKKGNGGGGKEGEGPVATTHSEEVRIKAIFFEGNRRALQEIGVDWSTISENVPDAILNSGSGSQGGGGSSGGQSGQNNTPQLPNSSFNGPFVQVNAKGAQSVSQDVFNSIINFGEVGNTGIRVQALFSAFEADNLGQILASPNIKVLDGQQGRIQVGQDFSIKQRDFSGNVVDKFFSVGTILEVTPQVIKQNDTTFIHLDIDAQRSNAQPDPVSTVINKQQAQTQALLLDGESTVIAGLYNTESTEVRKGIPILKDLPPWFFGLRYLFGYNSKDFQTRELVILIQASLEPTIPERLADESQKQDSYEVLHDERQRMENEVKHGQKILKGEMDKESEVNVSDEPDSASKEQSMMKQETPNKEKAEKDKNSDIQKQSVEKQEEKKEKSPVVSDPELHPQKIQLDLGGHEEMKGNPEAGDEIATDTNSSNEVQDRMSTSSDDQTHSSSSQKKYYIVGGSFKKKANAREFRDKLQGEGYNSVILQKNDFMFVTYQEYDDLDSAKTAISQIQQNENSGAWLC